MSWSQSLTDGSGPLTYCLQFQIILLVILRKSVVMRSDVL